MKKRNVWAIVLIIVAVVLIFLVISMFASLFASDGFLGNVAVIPVNGVITVQNSAGFLSEEGAPL